MKPQQRSVSATPLSEPRWDIPAHPKQILVPIDLSESSTAALRHAATLARNERAHLILLNVVDEPVTFRSLDFEDHQRELRQDHTLRLRQLARQELGPDADSEIVVCEGSPSHQIAETAARRHADLIIMARREHHGLRRWLRARTASHVLRNAPCPVLVLDGPQPNPIPAKLAA